MGWEDSPGVGNGNPLQYSCLGNPMDRGAWQLQPIGLQRVWHDLVHTVTFSTVICRNEQSSGLGSLSLAVPIPFSHAAFFQNKLPCSFQWCSVAGDVSVAPPFPFSASTLAETQYDTESSPESLLWTTLGCEMWFLLGSPDSGALGRFPPLVSSGWQCVPKLKRLCLPPQSSPSQLQVSDGAMWVSEWMESEYWRLLCHLTPFSQGLSAHCSAPSSFPGCLFKEGRSHMGSSCYSPCWRRSPEPWEVYSLRVGALCLLI